MKRLLLLIFFQLLLVELMFGQSDTILKTSPKKIFKNCFELQLGGTTGWYSANYERYFRHKRLPRGYLLAGFGFFKIDNNEMKWNGWPLFLKTGAEFGSFRADIGVSRVITKNSFLWTSPGGAVYYSHYYKNHFTFFEVGVSRVFWKRLVLGVHAFPIHVSDQGGISDFLDLIDKDAFQLKKAGRNWVYWGSFKVGFLF